MPCLPFLYAERATEFQPYVKYSIDRRGARGRAAAIARAYYVAMQPRAGPTSCRCRSRWTPSGRNTIEASGRREVARMPMR